MLWWTLQRLKSSNPDLRKKAAQDLGSAKQRRAVPSLIKVLQDGDPQVRLAAIRALGAIGHPASADPLMSSLVHPPSNAKSRSEAECQALAEALAGVGSGAVKPLVQALSSEDKEARRWAAHALGLVKDPQATEPLVKKLDDSRSEVRKAAALALGEIGDSRALDALIKALANRDPETRRAAAEGLGSIRSEAGVPALVRAAADPGEPVQLAAIEALGKIGGLPAAACLRSAMSGSRKKVCEAAESALKGMPFSPAGAEDRAELAVLRGKFEEALQEGQAAVPALAKALKSNDPQMRLKAAEALGAIRSPESLQPLHLALRDHYTPVQECAARALAGRGEAARPGLEASLSFYVASVVGLAAGALGEIGDPRSISALVDLIEANRVIPVDNPDLFDAVRAAVDSLGRILSASAGKSSRQDLERAESLPEEVRLSGPDPKILDCREIVKKAAEELGRR